MCVALALERTDSVQAGCSLRSCLSLVLSPHTLACACAWRSPLVLPTVTDSASLPLTPSPLAHARGVGAGAVRVDSPPPSPALARTLLGSSFGATPARAPSQPASPLRGGGSGGGGVDAAAADPHRPPLLSLLERWLAQRALDTTDHGRRELVAAMREGTRAPLFPARSPFRGGAAADAIDAPLPSAAPLSRAPRRSAYLHWRDAPELPTVVVAAAAQPAAPAPQEPAPVPAYSDDAADVLADGVADRVRRACALAREQAAAAVSGLHAWQQRAAVAAAVEEAAAVAAAAEPCWANGQREVEEHVFGAAATPPRAAASPARAASPYAERSPLSARGDRVPHLSPRALGERDWCVRHGSEEEEPPPPPPQEQQHCAARGCCSCRHRCCGHSCCGGAVAAEVTAPATPVGPERYLRELERRVCAAWSACAERDAAASRALPPADDGHPLLPSPPPRTRPALATAAITTARSSSAASPVLAGAALAHASVAAARALSGARARLSSATATRHGPAAAAAALRARALAGTRSVGGGTGAGRRPRPPPRALSELDASLLLVRDLLLVGAGPPHTHANERSAVKQGSAVRRV